MDAQTVLDFWFLPEGDAGHGASREVWFRKDAQFDAQIRTRFGAAIEQALAGGLADWDGAHGMLARILLLDQFTRNAYRDTARAFAGDAQAQAATQALLAAGLERGLIPVQRWFAYMPFEHAEDLALQLRSVALFGALAAAAPELTGILDYAQRHHAVIARFGRFPHRNAALGRASTPEESAYLATPGAGF